MPTTSSEGSWVVDLLLRLDPETRGVELSGLPADVLRAAHPALGSPELAKVLDPALAVERRALIGGPARETVARAAGEARSRWASKEG